MSQSFTITSPAPPYSRALLAKREWGKGRDVADPQTDIQVQNNPATHFGTTSINSSSAREHTLRTEGLWQEYFTDPSPWWDDRKSKTNPRAFRLRIPEEVLWVDCWDNERWVEDMLEKKFFTTGGSQEVSEVNVSSNQPKEGQTCSSPMEELARSHYMCYGRSKCGVQVDPQLPDDGSMLRLEETLSILDRMPELPSVEDYVCMLQKFRKKKDLVYAKRVHVHLCNKGLESHKGLGNYIVPMFVECGSVPDAQQVFDRLIHHSEHSWTSLMSGYVLCGQAEHGLSMFHKMQKDGVHPSSYTFLALLKACSSLKDVKRGKKIHANVAEKGFIGDLFVGSSLVHMYAKCGSTSEAQDVFDKLPVQNVVSWNALIAGYSEHGPRLEALKCFEHMQLEGMYPDAITFACILKACGSMGVISKGREIHAAVMQKGFESYLFVCSTLVDMYAKCGSLAEAHEAFVKLPCRDAVSWNALISGYADHGHGHEGLECFQQMRLEGISLNAVTFLSVLKASGSIRAVCNGQEIHTEIARKGFERDLFVGSSLVDMYAKFGSLSAAQEAFDKLPVQNVVAWSALLAGYAEHGPAQEAWKCFKQMQLEGITPDALTFVCILKSCGSMGAVCKGREVHAEVAHKGFDRDLFVGSTLVDMYAKCGSVSEAQEVFDKLSFRNVVSWNAMIKGYDINYEGNKAIQSFEDMQEQGMKPNASTSTSFLTACSHSNLIFKGQDYIKEMRKDYGDGMIVEHCTCVAELLAQSGYLFEAEEFLETMWCPPTEETWTALLSACKSYGEVELGLGCFRQVLQMKPDSCASYVLMANIYGSAGRWDDAYITEELRTHAGQ